MKQTSVEWLLDWMGKNQYFIGNDLLEAVEQAKQMHKEEIVDAWRNGDNDSMYSPKELDEQAENYYSENYVSKESDKKQQKKLITEIMNEDAKDGLYNTSSQTEISDEEIEQYLSMEGHPLSYDNAFIDGAKWYREQLKQRK